MKRSLSVILAALLLASCGGTAEPSTDTTAAPDASGDTTPAETEVDLFADLPTGDFGGHKFNILGLADESSYIYVQMTAEEMNGDIINDTIFARNSKVQESLNIEIVYTGNAAPVKAAQTSILAGSDEFDIVFDQTLKLGPVTSEGIFLDISTMDGINLSKPWWKTSLAEQISVGGKIYMLHGDLNYHYLYNVWTLFFNQQTIANYKLESPYSLVKAGTWTVDKLIEYCRTAAQDINADGVYNLVDEDICGVVSNNSSFFALLYGAGGELVTKDGDTPVFKGATDKLTTIYDKLLAVTSDARVFNNYGTMTNDERFGRFAQGQFLFSLMMCGSSKALRDMPEDFGVVPMPKLNEAQKEYYSYAGPSMSTMAIPVTATDPTRTGTILEHLSAESYGTLRTAYLETTMKDKFMRDEQSVEMLDIIHSGIRMDIGYIYGFGGVHTAFMNTLAAGEGIVSALASVEPAVNAAIDKYLEDVAD